MLAVPDRLMFVKMKARRADEHFHFLEREVDGWARKPYTIVENTDFEKSLHVFRVEFTPTPEIIPMLFGDFVCCLRSALDQLAWRLAHLDVNRIFTPKEQRDISFPIFTDPWTYNKRRGLFPPAVARVLDPLQPDFREDGFRGDILWQLDKLWNLDKHRSTPSTSYDVTFDFSVPNWRQFCRIRTLPDRLEMAFPLSFTWTGEVDLKPQISVDILFGEAGNFEIKIARLGEINDFVRNDVIPRFTCFFT